MTYLIFITSTIKNLGCLVSVLITTIKILSIIFWINYNEKTKCHAVKYVHTKHHITFYLVTLYLLQKPVAIYF